MLAGPRCLLPEAVIPTTEQRFSLNPEAPGPDSRKPAVPPVDTSVVSRITYLGQKDMPFNRGGEH